MTIKTTSRVINFLAIFLVIAAALALLNLAQRIAAVDATADNRFYTFVLVNELRGSSEELTRQVRNYAVTGNLSAYHAYNRVLRIRSGEEPRPQTSLIAPGQRRVLLDLLGEAGITDEEFALVQRANALSDNLVALEVKAMNAVRGIFADAQGAFTIHGAPDIELATSLVFGSAYDHEVSLIMTPMTEFEQMIEARITRTMEEALSGQFAAQIISFVALAVVLAFSVLNLIYNSIFIVLPLQTVTGVLKTVVSGGKTHLGRRIAVKRKDEIGELSDFFNKTFENIGDLVKLLKVKSGELMGIGQDLSSNSTETASTMNEISVNVRNIKSRIMNQSASVTETHSTMEQLTSNINKLSSHVNNQSTHVSGVSSAVEQMVANIRSVTDTLVLNEGNVKTLMESSDIGRSGLHGVSQEIREIARESEGLFEINAVMENIASQTNLLSMNAAIEAAHAGDAGRGFAVVAGEIRKLAESSGAQSKTIGVVLKKMKDSIDKMSRSTENVLKKFEAIDSSVKTVVEQESSIRNSMEEQRAGSKQVLEGISSVVEITHQVNAGTEEMLEGAKEVIQESKNLDMVTQEIASGMNEIAAGSDQINTAVSEVNQLSVKNHDSIEALQKEIARFETD